MKKPRILLFLKSIIISFLFILAIGCSKTSDWQWSTQAGGNNSDFGKAITIDENRNTYITGSFNDFATFGSYLLTSSGDDDIFIAKMDASGKWIRAIKAGGRNSDSGKAITIDKTGNTYITGSFNNEANFGSNFLTSSGDNDIFVAKINAVGYWLWATKAGGKYSDLGRAITIDGSGNTYITGSFNNEATFGSHHITCRGRTAIFVAKLDKNGNWLWATQSGGTGGYGIATDNFGNIYIIGYFYDTATFGSISLRTNKPYDIFVAKMDANGNWLWATKAGREGNIEKIAIKTDNTGNSYITGSFYSTATFGSHYLTCSGGCNIFVAKIDTDGNWLWAKQSEGMTPSYGTGIAIDDSGNSYITGSFGGSTTIGTNFFTNKFGYGIFVAKIDKAGNWLWAINAGGRTLGSAMGIALDNAGNGYITGYFNNTVNFGSHSLKTEYYDIFVAKFSE